MVKSIFQINRHCNVQTCNSIQYLCAVEYLCATQLVHFHCGWLCSNRWATVRYLQSALIKWSAYILLYISLSIFLLVSLAPGVSCVWPIRAAPQCDVWWLLHWVLCGGQGLQGQRLEGPQRWLMDSWLWWALSQHCRPSSFSPCCCCFVPAAKGEYLYSLIMFNYQ